MLNKNTIVEGQNAKGDIVQERVLFIDNGGKQMVVINTSGNSLPYWIDRKPFEEDIALGNSRILNSDPWAELRSMRDIDIQKHLLEKRDSNWSKIENIVTDPQIAFSKIERSKAIKATGIRKAQIYELLRRFWQGGQNKNTLIPQYKGRTKYSALNKVGRKAKVAVDSLMEKRFNDGYRKFYSTEEKNTLKRAYALMIQHSFNNEKDDLPTFRQFSYWVNTRKSKANSAKARIGSKNFSLTKRPLYGSATTHVPGPGAEFQIDSTIADIHLVSETDRSVLIGRPTLFLVTDVFSRLITGFSLGLQGAGYELSSLAILNCTESKMATCAKLGIEINLENWPCQHLPEVLTADRGELEGPVANSIISGLNIRLDNTPPFRADMKGVIERKFQSANLGLIHWLPGSVKGISKRGEADPKAKAVLNLKEFAKLVVLWILAHNKSTITGYELGPELIRDKVKPIPLELWRWGIANRSGALRVEQQEVVKAQLLPRKEASITRKGILLSGLTYTCPTAETENWFFKAVERGRWRVNLAIDPRDCSNVYIQHQDGKLESCKLTLRDIGYQNLPWSEVIELRQIKQKIIKEAEEVNLTNQIDLQKEVDNVIKQAKAEQVIKPSVRSSNISEARKAELEKLARKDIPTPKLIVLPPPVEDDYIGEPDDLEGLRESREQEEN